MLRWIRGRMLLGVVLPTWVLLGRATMADVGPVPQWLCGREIGEQLSVVKRIVVDAAVKHATLEVMAVMPATVYLDEAGNRPLFPQPVESSSRWKKAEITQRLTVGTHPLVITSTGPVCARVRMEFVDGRARVHVTDPSWSEIKITRTKARQAVEGTEVPARSLGLVGIQPWGDPLGEEVDYNQWKKSIGTGKAEEAAAVRVTPGFDVELIRSAQPGESSWISLTFDPAGRVIIGREGRDKKHGLLRLTLPKQADGEVQVESLEDTLLEPRGLAFYGQDLFVNANNANSLVRLRDTDNDGRFDEQTVLKKTPGGVGHGRNNLCFGPDGKLYSIHGNDVRLPEDFDRGKVAEPGSPGSRGDLAVMARNPDMRVPFVALDRLRPCDWDGFLFDRQATLPAGHLARTDIEGARWEIVACGFRNPYGIAFNEDGEAFTFDADNEGDLGAPWYRPTRINHIVEGGDYGWRQGTAMRPDWYPDSMPSTLVIGKSSPTGIKFGTPSNFPPRYRQSLFILDWSYGRIYAVQLWPRGASYVGTAEIFVEGRPLNVTDLAFGPDGAMYFTTGGRGTQSGLYRVRYVGPDSLIAPPVVIPASELTQCGEARRRRRELERMQPTAADLAHIAAGLDDRDEWIRHAAMTALMRLDPAVLLAGTSDTPARPAGSSDGQEVPHYVEFVSASVKEPRGRFGALMSLARMFAKQEQARLLRLVCAEWERATEQRGPSQELRDLGPSPDQRLIALRAVQLCLVRLGEIAPPLRERVIKLANSALVGDTHEVDLLAFQILAHLKAAPIDKAIMRLETAARLNYQERVLVWLFELRNIEAGWAPWSRKAYLTALRHAGEHYTGGRELPVVLYSIGADYQATLTDAERPQYAELLATPAPVAQGELVPQRPLVKEWTVDELVPLLSKFEVTRERAERGRKMFEQANCVKCHRFAGHGQPIGPDLHGVSGRMGHRDLLETILVPSKVIDDKYRDTTLELKSGKILTGRLIGGDATRVLISPNPQAPLATVPVLRSDVESQKVSPVSPMPLGLLNSFHTDDILDLLAYLESNGATLVSR